MSSPNSSAPVSERSSLWIDALIVAGPTVACAATVLDYAHAGTVPPLYVAQLAASLALITALVQAAFSWLIDRRVVAVLLTTGWLLYPWIEGIAPLGLLALLGLVAIVARPVVPVLGSLLAAFAIWMAVVAGVRTASLVLADLAYEPPSPIAAPDPRDVDVWWLMLDGHARADVLAARYGMERSLHHGLQERGFFVADRARANYWQTALAVSSALNLDTLDKLLPESQRTGRDREVLRRAIAGNRLHSSLGAAGFRTVTVRSEYAMLNVPADRVRGSWPGLTEIEYDLIRRNGLIAAINLLRGELSGVEYALRRRHLHGTFHTLRRIEPTGPPHFIFSHVLAPHPPFVFEGPDTPAPSRIPFTTFDGQLRGILQERGLRSYDEGVVGMTRWTEAQVLSVVDHIQSLDRPAVIVIHSDHGPAPLTHGEGDRDVELVERLAILNAVYLPDQDYSDASPELTPIDTARWVLNYALGTDLPVRTEPSSYSSWEAPYRFEDVTEAARRGTRALRER